MLTKRIIPCLDIKGGRTVKGVQFENIRDAGDPIELARWYASQGADELVFLDITATNEGRKTFATLVRDIAREIDIPFTVGGGISTVQDVETLLLAGADKVSLNSAALNNPQLIRDVAQQFGSQCVTVAIDTKYTEESGWKVYTRAGTQETKYATVDWAKKAVAIGAGEILLTSMNNDGTKAGFALDITAAVSEAVPVPVIASGGAGAKEHFAEAFKSGNADAALAASLFHFRELAIPDLKIFLQEKGVSVRIP